MAVFPLFARAQTSFPDTSLARSVSGQFIVTGVPSHLAGSRLAAMPAVATNADFVRLEPALLAVSAERIKESLENVKTNHVENLVTIKQEDIFTLDLSQANVITLYLLPSLNVKLMPQLSKCKPGTRIVSHDFDMRGAKPVVVHKMTVEGDSSDENTNYGPDHTIYKWVVPWEKE